MIKVATEEMHGVDRVPDLTITSSLVGMPVLQLSEMAHS